MDQHLDFYLLNLYISHFGFFFDFLSKFVGGRGLEGVSVVSQALFPLYILLSYPYVLCTCLSQRFHKRRGVHNAYIYKLHEK